MDLFPDTFKALFFFPCVCVLLVGGDYLFIYLFIFLFPEDILHKPSDKTVFIGHIGQKGSHQSRSREF